MADELGDDVPILCPSWAVSVGYVGVASAAILSNFGSAWGTWKAGVSLVHTGIRHPSSVMKNVIPIVMAGVIGIYGLIVAVILAESITSPNKDRQNGYSIYTAMAHLAAGLCCGISGLAAGGCIGIVGDHGVRAVGYRASQISLFPSTTEKAGYSEIPSNEGDGGDDVSGSEDQNKLFVGMLIMLIFSEALALYGLIVALIVSQHSYNCLD
uniref:V-type proton ATPase proteolipid subunit n=1 Tax=Helicotheca tamesis TaxID=374047 RepID=A0A7S2ICD4_9STRA|mmetsp:Transcript_7656/g.10441  ORF Transcript_7656/g.10441 Transcript_7656/m.10441 type:complete len:211 (+) Transcript_7656:97-729(+)|eukprot:CAMPEP_0185729092 /NCGR_PEP_ID=MMETSP1171-20130828/4462_1 /TAXON_ID=374046 /ORGANISM="Helicotheca tamensis, Strain CCMP826" /LENGTH=210 /DNA_ID=CAMNT_0028397865 /DNA_START=90 /DNA_END=722 /DNA_ORIENTATION=+